MRNLLYIILMLLVGLSTSQASPLHMDNESKFADITQSVALANLLEDSVSRDDSVGPIDGKILSAADHTHCLSHSAAILSPWTLEPLQRPRSRHLMTTNLVALGAVFFDWHEPPKSIEHI